MRQKRKVIIFGCVISVILLSSCTYVLFFEAITTNFAEKITFRFDYFDTKIDLQITDKNDFDELISVCKGIAFKGSPSCGFGSAELIFEGNGKGISIFPSCDGCDLMQINDSDKYFSIGKENRKRLVEILKKYGAVFPCF